MFIFNESYSSLVSSAYATDRHREAVVTSKIHNPVLDRLCAAYFDPSSLLFGFQLILSEPLDSSTNQPLCSDVTVV